MGIWFKRDSTGREMSDREQGFLQALARMLDDVHPAQLDAAESALTAEGTSCLIALLPHRLLSGISIFVYFFQNSAEVGWAQVGGHDGCHCALDEGVSCARVNGGWRALDVMLVVEAVRAQLAAALTLRIHDDAHATVHVQDRKGRLALVGTVPREWNPTTTQLRSPGKWVEQVRLVDSSTPSVAQPSNASEWFG